MRVSRVDPFGERQRRTWRRRYLVLGARVDFECETAALAAVVDAAYAGLPVTRARRGMPVYRVCLRFMADDTADFRGAPPLPKVFVRRRAHQRDDRCVELLGGGARPAQRAGRGVTRNAGATL